VLYTSTSCTAGCGNTAWLNNRQLIVGTGGAKHYTCWVKADMGNWMGSFGIPNDTPVTTMWIPATHDTMALYGDLNTKVGQISDPFNYAKTQDLSLTEQLDAGIRALDIRVKYQACTAQELRIFHGEFYQKTNWIEVNGVTRINIFEPNSPRRVFQQLDGSAPTNQIDRTLRQSSDSRTDGPYL
jgi:hypothetical protein